MYRPASYQPIYTENTNADYYASISSFRHPFRIRLLPTGASPKFPLISLRSTRRLCRDLVNYDLTRGVR